MLSKGSMHSWAEGEKAASEGPDLSLRCTGLSQQRKLPFLFVKPSLLKEVLFFAFVVTLLKMTQVKPKSFPHASFHVEETIPELRTGNTQLLDCLQHHPTAAAPRAKPGGQQQWSTLQAAGHMPAAAQQEEAGRTGQDYKQQ